MMQAAAFTTVPQTPIHVGICMGPPEYRSLESQLSTAISGALRGRSGDHAVTVYDRVTSVYCTLNGGRHFDSASIVKAIILAALLRWHQETSTPLSASEKSLATLMITQSDNDAATDLWNELGMTRLQHFLDLADMNETKLGQDGYWGLTGVTAHDEMLLLELLTKDNPVLTDSSRAYELGLMAQVIGWEAWGVTAGTPSGVTWHVKNGWLPDDTGWHINSIGAFTGNDKDYMIAVLTDGNPSEQYGIDTIENVTRPVQKDINAAKPPAKARLAVSARRSPAARPQPSPSPWAVVPALPTPARAGG
jgi:beta-lactamase class A